MLFRSLNDRVTLRVLINRSLLESSVKDSSSGSSVVDSSLGSSLLFFRHSTIFFIKTCYYFFKLRTDVLVYIRIKNEETLALYRQKILYWKYMLSIFRFVNYLYCWIYTSYRIFSNKHRTFGYRHWNKSLPLISAPSNKRCTSKCGAN